MIMRRAAICAFVVAGPAAADERCHDLWFARNAIMDRAGYCFGSVLGQAVFDNEGWYRQDGIPDA